MHCLSTPQLEGGGGGTRPWWRGGGAPGSVSSVGCIAGPMLFFGMRLVFGDWYLEESQTLGPK